MDRMRDAAEASVRRITMAGLLVVATLVAPLGGHPRMALDATSLLLSIETALLWQLGVLAPRLPFGRAEAWIDVGRGNSRRDAMYARLLAENFRSYARRLAIPTALAWAADLMARIFG